MRLKYITYERFGEESFVVFPQHVAHSDWGNILDNGRTKLLGAGEVSYYYDEERGGQAEVRARCYGESVSLWLKSRNNADSNILNRCQD